MIWNWIILQQHGFRPKTNSAEACAYMVTQIRINHQIDVVFLDMAKAFDREDHGNIAKKVASIGMPPCLYLCVICAYHTIWGSYMTVVNEIRITLAVARSIMTSKNLHN